MGFCNKLLYRKTNVSSSANVNRVLFNRHNFPYSLFDETHRRIFTENRKRDSGVLFVPNSWKNPSGNFQNVDYKLFDGDVQRRGKKINSSNSIKTGSISDPTSCFDRVAIESILFRATIQLTCSRVSLEKSIYISCNISLFDTICIYFKSNYMMIILSMLFYRRDRVNVRSCFDNHWKHLLH